jgi:DNA-binding XRE family transcriptional regulator
VKKDLVSFGKKVRLLRLESKLTQVQLAAEIDVDVRTIKSIEAGTANPTLKLILSLAQALKVDVKEFF